jgi:hypothetical protein
LTNLATMLISLAVLVAFYLILRNYNVRRSLLYLGLFAFIPVVWIQNILFIMI